MISITQPGRSGVFRVVNSLSFFCLRNKKIFVAIIILVIANLPYLIHIQQDLEPFFPRPYDVVCHDEASFGMNAKDILLFGRHSLEHDRLYIIWALNVLIALVSFSLFGISLAALRLPYIVLNILCNILFFDFVRRTAGKRIAFVTTFLFTFFPSRILIGKSGMVESLVLPLIMAISWTMIFSYKRPRIHFFLGLLSGLAGIAKFDNLIVFLFLLTFAIIDDIIEKNTKHTKCHLVRTKWLLIGFGIVALGWGIFAVVSGLENFIYYYKFELGINIPRLWFFEFRGNMGSLKLIKANMEKVWSAIPVFPLLICVLIPLIMKKLILRDFSSWRNPLFRGIILFFGLLVFKIAFSISFPIWRLAPCYPLPFLMMAYVCIDYEMSPKLRVSNRPFSLFNRVGMVLVGVCILFFILPLANTSLQRLRQIIFHPTYRILESIERVRKTLNPRFRIVFAEGHFTYLTLFLPVKCYDVVPNIKAKDFFTLESDPKKMWTTIQRDKQIAYLMVREENKLVLEFVESIPGAQLIMTNVLPYGSEGRIYQIRWPQNDKQTGVELRGKWE